MGEESNAAVTIPRSSATSSLSLRFLGLLKQPDDTDLDPNLPTSSSPLELDESDVVWSSSDNSSPCSVSSPVATSPGPVRRSSRSFVPGAFGLSALLESSSPGPGPGPLRRQSSPVTPPVAVPIARPSTPSRKAFNQSAPVAVPVWPGRRREGRKGRGEAGDDLWGLEEDEEEMAGIEDDGEEMVPPHVIIARSHMTSFSVLEGAGRTLKGRDLRRVRNAVLQKTGFLDVHAGCQGSQGCCCIGCNHRVCINFINVEQNRKYRNQLLGDLVDMNWDQPSSTDPISSGTFLKGTRNATN